VLFKIDFEKAYDKVSWNFVRDVMEKKGFPGNGLTKQCRLSKVDKCALISM
jgi:hypothetical protein